MPVLFLSESDVRNLLTMDLALLAVEAAFRKLSLDEATNIPRQRCQTDHVMLHVLPAAAKTLNAIGYKAYVTGNFPAQFLVTLYDPKSGDLMAWIQADYLGQVRTGAASGVATKKLARAEANTLGIIGTGKQARTQCEAIANVRSLTAVHVYSSNREHRLAFAAEMSKSCGIPVTAVESAEAAVTGKDIVVTATNAREPVLKGDWLADGCHVNLVGSNFLSKAEADVRVFERAALVVADSKDQAKYEAGDFVQALKDGVIHWSEVTDLSHILTGRYPGRQNANDITVFKSLGLGIQDIAIAEMVYEKAKAAGVGKVVDL
jgi:alanine dehydrogenase